MEECPYCLSPILDAEEVTTCRVCGTPYHTECLDENGGCALNDCETRIRPKSIEISVDAEPRTMLVLSRESVEKAPEVRAKKQSNPCLRCGTQLPIGELYCTDCEPISADSLNFRKLAPLMILVAVIALVVGWLALSVLTPNENTAGGAASHDVAR